LPTTIVGCVTFVAPLGDAMLKSLVGLLLVLGILTTAQGDTPKYVARNATVNGILARLDGRDLIVRVKQANGEQKEITLPTDDNTEVRVDGDPGRIDDLRPEMLVQVTAAARNVAGPARLIRATSKSLSGVVIRLDGRNVVIKAQGQGDKEVTVETDSRTQILFAEPGAAKLASTSTGRLEDIKPAMRVKVLPDSGTARKILVSGGAKKTEKNERHK
jgi:hypothetical protein